MIPALARWNGDHAMTKDTTKEAAVAAEALLLDDWFDAIEDGVRARARGFIETMLEEELSEALSRPRYGRRKPGEDEAAPSVVGVRHGHRERTLTGTFGKTRIAVPRARLTGEDGKTREWRSGSLRAYQRRTRAADALIAGAYLAGTNTRRVRRALNAVFAGPVGKDVVSRVWRKTKGDWDAWNARSLAEEPIVRLILDGTVARVRLDRKATSISLLVALGVRADGQKMLLAIKNMGGESEAAWRALLDDLDPDAADCRGRSWSSSTARRASKRRWRRCGPTWLSNAAPCTSIAISSPTRPSACTRKSRTTTAT
jgi:transposase-like protein